MSTSSDKPATSGGSHYQPSMAVVAVILVLFIGAAFLVQRSSTPAAPGKHPSTTTTTHHSSGGSTTTTTPAHHVSKSQVSVQVTNGTTVAGLARTYTVKLQTLGWDTLSPINGPHETATVIFFKAGYQWAASEIATELHVPQSAAQPLGAKQPVAGAQGDDIVIVLGPNVAH